MITSILLKAYCFSLKSLAVWFAGVNLYALKLRLDNNSSSVATTFYMLEKED